MQMYLAAIFNGEKNSEIVRLDYAISTNRGRERKNNRKE